MLVDSVASWIFYSTAFAEKHHLAPSAFDEYLRIRLSNRTI
jgi:hypothetical protein